MENLITLNNGIKMPLLGFGTSRTKGETERIVLEALKAGYRQFDTASRYENEEEVGNAIKKSGIPREEIFITTKIGSMEGEHGYPEKAFNDSLKRLQVDYIDLYLIHWPTSGRLEVWKFLEKKLEEGKVKSIGVGNFTIRHLKELFENSKIIPVVNQVEFNPFLYQKELLEFCNENKIHLEGYCPLTRGHKLDDSRLIEISKKYKKSPAQLLIRWALQHNVISIPKSQSEVRMKENLEVFDFEISEEDMNIMNSWNENFRVTSDPEKIP
jgi:diketogulonate reductase-like aldo/keto reductase|tara:strand:+ start:104 stop:910 length:807 start_codon:yes stop_codon:yes gene_type:complete